MKAVTTAVALLPLLTSCANQPETGAGPTPEIQRFRVSMKVSEEGPSIPFLLEVQEGMGASVLNGEERIRVPEFWTNHIDDEWLFRFDQDSELRLARNLLYDIPVGLELPLGSPLRSREVTPRLAFWRLRRGARPATEMKGHASRVEAWSQDQSPIERFPVVQSIDDATPIYDLAPRYAVKFSSSEDPAVGTFETFDDGRVHGNFRTTLGDYRYLAGDRVGNHLRLSCFDGHHLFLFTATIGEGGVLEGDFWSRDSWHETWTATPDPEADLPDTFALTEWNKTADPEAVTVTYTNGQPYRLSELVGNDRPTVILAFGTWCPNCHDAMRLWAELERTYNKRGLRVIGLAFELTSEKGKELQKIRDFAEREGIDFELFLTGLADKDKASEALPILDRVRAYPTTIFLKRDGRPLAVHTGFDGPATGEAHQRLRERFEDLIADLLAD